MPRFFVSADQVAGGDVRIEGDDAAHLARSLRAVPGERIVVADDGGREHGVRIESVTPAAITGIVEWSRPLSGEPAVEVHVLQALAKDGMDDVVEALSMAGAAAIWPVLTQRTVARPDDRRALQRVQRWQTIARNAAGLAGRGRPPQVHALQPLTDALDALPKPARVLACAVSGEVSLPRLRQPPRAGERVAVVIGPEGGLADEEVNSLRALGAEIVHLGPRVLRARLAGVVAISLLLSGAGELDAAPLGWPAPEATAP